MNFRKIIASILCLTILTLLLAGCSTINTVECDFPDCGPDSPAHINFNAALATFPPDTVMIKSGDLSISWAHLYIILFNTVSTLIDSDGVEIPWDEDVDGLTLDDLVLDFSTSEAKTFLAYMYGIEASNLILGDRERAEFKQDIDGYIDEMGGKDALEEHLRETGGVYNFEVFENILFLEFSVGLLADSLFGVDASEFSNESVAEFINDNDFDLLMAMHILRMKTDDDSATPLMEAEEILRRLRPQASSATFSHLFLIEMFEHSDDSEGLRSFPNGYLFLPDAMVPEFSETTAALGIGEMSDIVETEYGYHIILRIPLNYDTSLLTRDGSSPGTFRQIAAASRFEEIIVEWFDLINQNIEYSSEYESLDIAKIFGLHIR